MMKIFLGNTPWHEGEKRGVRAGSRWPHFVTDDKIHQVGNREILGYVPFPFYLAYAAGVLEEAGYEVLLVDGIAEGFSDDEYFEKIMHFQPDIILTEVSTPTMDYDLRYARRIRHEYRKDGTIVFAGSHGEFTREEFLMQHPDVDYVIYGEYEYPFLQLVKALQNGGDVSNCESLAYRASDGRVVVTSRAKLRDLNDFPQPAYHHLPMLNYHDDFCELPRPSVQLNASRGCPYACIFCMWPQIMYAGHSYRTLDPVKVVDEMEYLVKTYDMTSVYFDDDTFNIGMPRVQKIAKEIIKRNINVKIGLMCRGDLWDFETLRLFKDAGLYAVKYGVESGVQELVDNAKKNLSIAKIKEGIMMTKELGIKVHLTFMFGLPGETLETIQQTIDFVMECDPDSVQFSYTVPFPGTAYFDIAKKQGILASEDWNKYSGNTAGALRTSDLSPEELQHAVSQATGIWGRHIQSRWIKEHYTEFKQKIVEKLQSRGPLRRVLLIRSSFEAHAKAVIRVLAEMYPDVRVDMILQNDVLKQFQEMAHVDQCHVYHQGLFSLEGFRRCFPDPLVFQSYDMGILLYNQQHRSDYRDLEQIMGHLPVGDAVGIKYYGDCFSLNRDSQLAMI